MNSEFFRPLQSKNQPIKIKRSQGAFPLQLIATHNIFFLSLYDSYLCVREQAECEEMNNRAEDCDYCFIAF